MPAVNVAIYKFRIMQPANGHCIHCACDVIHMALSKNAILVIIVAVVVVAAGASAAVVLSKDNKDPKSPALLPGAELKVLGNVEGDDDLDRAT